MYDQATASAIAASRPVCMGMIGTSRIEATMATIAVSTLTRDLSAPIRKPAKTKGLTARQAVILKELRKLKSHPTAARFYENVKEHFPRLKLRELTRELDALVDRGMAQAVRGKRGAKKYDGNSKGHYHITCMRCSRMDDITVNLMGAIDRAVALDSGYEIIDHAVVFYGLCRKCREATRG